MEVWEFGFSKCPTPLIKHVVRKLKAPNCMNSEVENKLKRIADVWNDFIWEYKFCSRKINFSEDLKSNYFGDILGYFQDTFDIIYTEQETKTYVDRFSYHMSLLQAIYIQQDFVEELLVIFKCGVDKGELKNDENFSINREIRNELVGHPIRKIKIADTEGETISCDSCGTVIRKPKSKLVLLSSTLFSYNSNNDTIQYLRYHKDNNYNFESRTFKISEIIARHNKFLNRNFDIIVNKLMSIIKKYSVELNKLNSLIENRDFETLIKLVEINYESIFNSDYIYDKASLIKIYNRKSEHERYQNVIDKFYSDLKTGIADTKDYIHELIEPKPFVASGDLPKIKMTFKDFSNTDSNDLAEKKVTYHYELGKLASKRNSMDFVFFSGFLKLKCSENELVINELKHMENNIDDEIEYYSAFKLISKELKE